MTAKSRKENSNTRGRATYKDDVIFLLPATLLMSDLVMATYEKSMRQTGKTNSTTTS